MISFLGQYFYETSRRGKQNLILASTCVARNSIQWKLGSIVTEFTGYYFLSFIPLCQAVFIFMNTAGHKSGQHCMLASWERWCIILHIYCASGVQTVLTFHETLVKNALDIWEHSRNVEHTRLLLVFSTIPSCSQMLVVFCHRVNTWLRLLYYGASSLPTQDPRAMLIMTARRKNRCTCAVNFGSSSRLSIFKMVDGESTINTSLSWLLATSCSLKVFLNNSATLGNHSCRCFDCDREDRNGFFSFIRR